MLYNKYVYTHPKNKININISEYFTNVPYSGSVTTRSAPSIIILQEEENVDPRIQPNGARPFY
jgi:hypothetical protein